MIVAFVVAAFLLLALGLPYLARVFAGPTIFDRLVGLGGFGTKAALLFVLAGLAYDRLDMFVDLAIGFLLLNLVTTLVVARTVRERGAIRG